MGIISSINGKIAYKIPVGVSELGTMVLDNVVFPASSYFDYHGNPVEFSKLKLDDARLTVNRAKRITKSTINGQKGTIKEFFGLDDYTINLDGSINSIIGFPAEKWQAFAGLQEVPKSIKVRSKFLGSIFGIDYVVIESFTAKQGGSENCFDINMTLLSDIPISFDEFG